jgi:hypothetical protein
MSPIAKYGSQIIQLFRNTKIFQNFLFGLLEFSSAILLIPRFLAAVAACAASSAAQENSPFGDSSTVVRWWW